MRPARRGWPEGARIGTRGPSPGAPGCAAKNAASSRSSSSSAVRCASWDAVVYETWRPTSPSVEAATPCHPTVRPRAAITTGTANIVENATALAIRTTPFSVSPA